MDTLSQMPLEKLQDIVVKVAAENWKNILRLLIQKRTVSLEEIQSRKKTRVGNITTAIEMLNQYLEGTSYTIECDETTLSLTDKDTQREESIATMTSISGKGSAIFQEPLFSSSYGVQTISLDISAPFTSLVRGNIDTTKKLLQDIISGSENQNLQKRIDFEKQSIDGIDYKIEEFIEKVKQIIVQTLTSDSKARTKEKRLTKVQEKTSQILIFLKEHQGKIIKKEELAKRADVSSSGLYPFLKKLKEEIKFENDQKNENEKIYFKNIPFNVYIYGTQQQIEEAREKYKTEKEPSLKGRNTLRAKNFLNNFRDNIGEYFPVSQLIDTAKAISSRAVSKKTLENIILSLNLQIKDTGYIIENIPGKGYIYDTKAHLALLKDLLIDIKAREKNEKKNTQKGPNLPQRIFNYLLDEQKIGKVWSKESLSKELGCALQSVQTSQIELKKLLDEYNAKNGLEEEEKLVFDNLRGKGWIIGTQKQIKEAREKAFGKKSIPRQAEKKEKGVYTSLYAYPKNIQKLYPFLRAHRGELITKKQISIILAVQEASLNSILPGMREIIKRENENISLDSQKMILENIRGKGYIYGTQEEIEKLQGKETKVNRRSKAQEALSYLLENRGKTFLVSNLILSLGIERSDFSPLLAQMKNKIREYNSSHGLSGAQEIEIYKTPRGAYVVGNYSETRDAEARATMPSASINRPQINSNTTSLPSLEGLFLNTEVDISKFGDAYDKESGKLFGKEVSSDQALFICIIATINQIKTELLLKYIEGGKEENNTENKKFFLHTLKAQINNIFIGIFQIISENDIWCIQTDKKKASIQRSKSIKERVTFSTKMRDFFIENPGVKFTRVSLCEHLGMAETSFNVALRNTRNLVAEKGEIVSIRGGDYIFKEHTSGEATTSKGSTLGRVASNPPRNRYQAVAAKRRVSTSLTPSPNNAPSYSVTTIPKTPPIEISEYTGTVSCLINNEKISQENTDIQIDFSNRKVNNVVFSENEFSFFLTLLSRRGEEIFPKDVAEDINMTQLLLFKSHINNILGKVNGYLHIQKGEHGFFLIQPDIKTEKHYSVKENTFSVGKDDLYMKFNGKMLVGFSPEQISIVREIIKKKERSISYSSYHRPKYESIKTLFQNANIGYVISIQTSGKSLVRLLHISEEVIEGKIQTKQHLLKAKREMFSQAIKEQKGIIFSQAESAGLIYEYDKNSKICDIMIGENEISLHLEEENFLIFLLFLSNIGKTLTYVDLGEMCNIDGEVDKKDFWNYISEMKSIINNELKREEKSDYSIITQNNSLTLKQLEKKDTLKTVSFGDKGILKWDTEKSTLYWEQKEISHVPKNIIEYIERLVKKYRKDGSLEIDFARSIKAKKNPEGYFNPASSFLKENNLPFKLTHYGNMSFKEGYLPR